MRWTLTEDQELFQESFKGWLERFAPADRVRSWLEAGDPTPFERRFVEEGWFTVGTAEENGGQGGGLVELTLAAEELGRAVAPSSAWLAAVLAAPFLSGKPELAASSLEDGEFAVLALSADRPLDADGQTGEYVLAGDRARRFLVPDGDRVLLAEASAVPRKLLDRSRSVADLVVEPGEVVLSEGGQVLRRQAALRAAVLVAADSLGAAERMLGLAVEYSKQRHQFGVPIGSFQAVKHAAATMLVDVEAARSLVYYAAASVEAGHEDAVLHAAAAKAQVCAAGERVADSALTVHGAIGYTWEHDLQLFYKRAKLNNRLFGGPSVWNERLAAALPLVPVA
ncbi:acyl-CoA dehydrogenase [Amycolatopsis sp. NBRC 101858]|uniref:acyl-CoA dehydrogenase family protein n=1 Tax=Amycolatopsis sp. NBRC 101858 TaxID=3032200 RepID=UPI0024A19677|nr:acyl-CoA dehydrogenase family protein [Amycolatopsis sp. NBRC 101858]GLY40413.1 acyl-CoA dehydrogenase [Amycolatopsis sp. NBRC 101858]